MRLLAGTVMAGMLFLPTLAGATGPLFDVAARRAELKTPAFAAARQACLAPAIKLGAFPKPLSGLKPTEGYGTDNSAEGFSWVVMVLSGRALAGDEASAKSLTALLTQWAEANALSKTVEAHDAYYALKRVLLPTITAYSILYDQLSAEQRTLISGWLDPLVRKIDKKFDGDVDWNNHRYLADSVLMAWGAMNGDGALYQKGIARYEEALTQARADGGLPLEVRRGSRAAWYMRQSLANLAVMAEIAKLKGTDLYGKTVDNKNYDLILTYFLNVVHTPMIGFADAAKNYKPGPEPDFMAQDRGMLHTRPGGRHYMAFAEAVLRDAPASFAKERLAALMQEEAINKDRPMIDEFSGGNGTCFWWKP